MVAVRQFDEDDVLDRIMQAFWRRGFVATSIDDLVAATGVKRGSLYVAFGDKQRMFLLAFERYSRRMEDALLQPLDQPDLRTGLTAMCRCQLDAMADRSTPPGCLIANSIAEAGGRGDAIEEAVRHRHAETEAVLRDRLIRAQRDGQITASRDPQALARFLAGSLRSASLVHGLTGDRDAAADIGTVALEAVFRKD